MVKITEDYVSFETSKLLKEKGFNKVKCQNSPHFAYNRDGQFSGPSWDTEYNAPTIQMAMKWLREVHNLFIEPYVVKNYGKKKLEYTYSIQDLDFQGSDDGIECCKNLDTPEQACEEAIKYCLENLI